jgi:hypothetical protein
MQTQYPPVQINKLIPYHEFEIMGCRGGLLSPRNKMFLNQQHMRTQDSPVQINKLIPYHEFEITGRRGGLLSSRNKMFLNQQHMRTQDSPEQINKLIPYHEFEIQHVGEDYCSPVIIKIIESTIRADTRSAPTVLKIQYFDGECALLFCV